MNYPPVRLKEVNVGFCFRCNDGRESCGVYGCIRWDGVSCKNSFTEIEEYLIERIENKGW